MGFTRVKGHGGPPGNMAQYVGDYTGPAAYVQYVAPNTGGDKIPMVALGLRSIDYMAGMGLTVSGTYYVNFKLRAGKGGSQQTAIAVWYVAATPGTQVAAGTNLTGETLRVFVIGG